MGYHTEFEGDFDFNKPLTPQQAEYINLFARTRRVTRNATKAAELDDPVRKAVGLPIGLNACYFVGGVGDFGQGSDPSIINGNSAPPGQPGLWCQWIVSSDNNRLEWDGGEKFYEYEAWLEYYVEHFFKPWGITISGEISWQGEEPDDRGTLYAESNRISAVHDIIDNPGPSW